MTRLTLGSRSPRRRELLEMLVPSESIDVRPPRSSDELGFEGLTSWLEIAQRLQRIAREKSDDVISQLPASDDTQLVLTADTVIVASDAQGSYRVLGHPPDNDSWQDVVRDWFRDLYAGRSHIAATAVCLTESRNRGRSAEAQRAVESARTTISSHERSPGLPKTSRWESWTSGRRLERIAQSHVWFRDDVEPLLDWYLATDEPRGKAGGYALQGLASVFVTRVEGSITNVVGLPLEALIEMLPQLGWPLR